MIIKLTPAKKAVEQAYQSNYFTPSKWYKTQSPFTPGYSKTSTWNLMYQAFTEHFKYIDTDTETGLVMFQIEWVVTLIEDCNISPNNFVFFSDNENKTKLAKKLGVRVIENLKELLAMEFDYVLKNAPYEREIGSEVKTPFRKYSGYSVFSYIGDKVLKENGLTFDILPTSFMAFPSAKEYRNWLLENYEIKNLTLYNNQNKEVFDINLSDIVTLVMEKKSNPDNTCVEMISYNSQPFAVDLTKYEFWPAYRNAASVAMFHNVMIKSKVDNCTGWNGGEKDSQKQPNTEYFISGNLVNMGERHMIDVHKSMKLEKNIRDIANPIWWSFPNKKERDLHFEWAKTKHYAYILDMVKSSPKNQPVWYGYMGIHNFLDDNFDKHFNITTTQQQEIEDWYQSHKQ
jgi:hypothetical protein